MGNVVQVLPSPKKHAAGLLKPAACNGFIILDYFFLELNSGN
jgi:hypothetical protein